MGEIIPIHSKRPTEKPHEEQSIVEMPKDWRDDIEARKRRAAMRILPKLVDPIPGFVSEIHDPELIGNSNDVHNSIDNDMNK